MKVKIGKLENSEYFWGEKSEIEVKVLPVIDVSVDGEAFLCASDKGLIMVDKKDVETIIL